MPSNPAARPIAAVLAVVLRGDHALLVQRASPPDQGLWGFPGGKVEFGETLFEAAARELQEETGVAALPKRILTALDAHDWAANGSLRQHFLLIAVECIWQRGEPVAADDALDARWVEIQAMEASLPLSRDVAALARQAAG